MSKYKEKYFRRKEKEFSKFIIQERNREKERLNHLRGELINYLSNGGNQDSKGWQYVLSQIEINEDRIKYMNNLLIR